MEYNSRHTHTQAPVPITIHKGRPNHSSCFGSTSPSEFLRFMLRISDSSRMKAITGDIFLAMMAGSSRAFVSGLKNAVVSREALLVDLLELPELSWSSPGTTNYTSMQQDPLPLPRRSHSLFLGQSKLHRRSTPVRHGRITSRRRFFSSKRSMRMWSRTTPRWRTRWMPYPLISCLSRENIKL